MNIGDFRTRRKVTGKLYLADLTTPTQFRNWGNVLLVKQEPKIDRAQQLTAQKGFVQVTHEEPSKVDLRYTIKFDELHDDALALLHLSSAATTVTQSAGTATAWSLSSVSPGYSYYVGAMGLTAFAVTGKTLNTDYTYDAGSGMIYIVPSGTIAASSSIAGTYTSTAQTFKQYTELTRTFRQVSVQLDTFDQATSLPRERVTFTGEVYISDYGDNDGQKYNEPTLMLLAITAPVVNALEIS